MVLGAILGHSLEGSSVVLQQVTVTVKSQENPLLQAMLLMQGEESCLPPKGTWPFGEAEVFKTLQSQV